METELEGYVDAFIKAQKAVEQLRSDITIQEQILVTTRSEWTRAAARLDRARETMIRFMITGER